MGLRCGIHSVRSFPRMDAGQRELVLTPQRSIRTYANPCEYLWNSYAIGALSVSLLYGIPAIFAEQAAHGPHQKT
jgi:hypothetical protein